MVRTGKELKLKDTPQQSESDNGGSGVPRTPIETPSDSEESDSEDKTFFLFKLFS